MFLTQTLCPALWSTTTVQSWRSQHEHVFLQFWLEAFLLVTPFQYVVHIGKCNSCLGLLAPQKLKSRATASGKPCAFSIVGCSNSADFFHKGSCGVCKSCYRSGYPCKHKDIGCVHTISLKQASLGGSCSHCITHGLPCVGPSGKGCHNPSKARGMSYPRRRLADNASCCLRCRPPQCCFDGCRNSVHSRYMSSMLCYSHGKAANNTSRSTGFAARFKRKRDVLCNQQCCVRGCHRPARFAPCHSLNA